MIKNVGSIDRAIRILIGVVLIALAATDRVGLWGWVVGVIAIATGVFSFCGLYAVLGFNTCPMRNESKTADL